MTITPRQQEIFDFICECIEENGYPPTLREIALKFELSSTNGVNDHLLALEKKGYIRRGADKSRAIEILKKFSPVGIPIVGRIAAGSPILAEQNIEGRIQMDTDYFPNHRSFFLRVKGESMVDAHIMNNDLVLIQQQPIARAGEIIAALLNDEATLKYYYPEHDHIELRPANSLFEPIMVNQDDSFQIVGKMIGLLRQSR